MDYTTFYSRFAGSYRTKHLNSPFDVVFKKTMRNKRSYFLQSGTEIPREFMRMEPWEGEYLFMVAARAKHGIVEIGRYNGGSLFLMSCANDQVAIHSVDIAPQNDDLLRGLLQKLEIGRNADIIVGDSQNGTFEHINPVDLLFVDGDHSYEGCTKDLVNWFPKVMAGGHILLHDCYHGSPVLDSVIDFARDNPVKFVNSPYIGREHWFVPTGSMVHLIRTE
jgi:predicted O-methyltransferase YrrM